MINNLILSPSVYFKKNQERLLNYILNNHTSIITGTRFNIAHFFINNKEYSLILNLIEDMSISFVKGIHSKESILTYLYEEVVFQTPFTFPIFDSEPIEAITVKKSLNSLNKIDYLCSRYNRFTSFSSFNKTDFYNFCSLLPEADSKIMIDLYNKEFNSIIQTTTFMIKDLFNTYKENPILQSEDTKEDLSERNLFTVINDNLCIQDNNQNKLIITLVEDNIKIYNINTMDFTDEELNTDGLIDFSTKDFIERYNQTISELEHHSYIDLSNLQNNVPEFNDFFTITAELVSLKHYLFEEHNIMDANKRIQPHELLFTEYQLLSNSDYVWHNDSLYNLGNIIGVDYLHLIDYIAIPNEEYLIICNSPLMLSYPESINKQWKTKIDDTIAHAESLFDKYHKDSSEQTKELFIQNLDLIKKYNQIQFLK